MAACKNLLMAVLLLSSVAAYAAAAAGDGDLRGEDYVGPMTGVASGEYAVCRTGCPDAFFNCNDWCKKKGYKNGGECVPPLRQQCCCLYSQSA